MLLGRASTVEHSDELCDCKSVTPTFDHSTIEALLSICPLCLLGKPKKHQPPPPTPLGPPGWWSLGFINLVVMIVFSVRWRFGFSATWADFNFGLLGLIPFYYSASDVCTTTIQEIHDVHILSQIDQKLSQNKIYDDLNFCHVSCIID
jgi:hypothetical protein